MTPEFWRDEERAQRQDLLYTSLRLAATFVLLFLAVMGALHWAGKSVHFSASRVESTTRPTWRVYGIVTDTATSEPVPFAHVADDSHMRPPLHATQADHLGHFELLTIAEPHEVVISALGYHARSAAVGRQWFEWTPEGSERLQISLEREP
jgi:hypothetical protein